MHSHGQMIHRIGFGLLVAILAAGCQSPEQPRIELTESQKEQLQPFLLDDTPQPDHQINVEYENQIRLLGVDVDGDVDRGEQVEMTWYWKALEDINADWQIFVHFDSEESQFRQNLDHFPVGEELNDSFRTYHWEEGEIIADVHRFSVNDEYPEGEAVFYVGLFRGETRAEVTSDGPTTDDDRAIGPRVDISAAAGEQ